MELADVTRTRRSVKKYDPEHAIGDDELKVLFDRVVLSPSSFNMQHWRFVVVRDPAQKAAVKAAAMNQPQVGDASAVIVVCGKLDAHKDAARILEEAPAKVRQSSVPMIEGFYEGKPEFQRDEAIRGASLAAMTLMLTACDMGYATGPMIGFDPDGVRHAVAMPDNLIPVMLMVIGRQVGDMRDRAMRLGLDEVVKLDSFDGPGLGESR